MMRTNDQTNDAGLTISPAFRYSGILISVSCKMDKKKFLENLNPNPHGFKTITKATACGWKEPLLPHPWHSTVGRGRGVACSAVLKICLIKREKWGLTILFSNWHSAARISRIETKKQKQKWFTTFTIILYYFHTNALIIPKIQNCRLATICLQWLGAGVRATRNRITSVSRSHKAMRLQLRPWGSTQITKKLKHSGMAMIPRSWYYSHSHSFEIFKPLDKRFSRKHISKIFTRFSRTFLQKRQNFAKNLRIYTWVSHFRKIGKITFSFLNISSRYAKSRINCYPHLEHDHIDQIVSWAEAASKLYVSSSR
jgi:hypothetical protein